MSRRLRRVLIAAATALTLLHARAAPTPSVDELADAMRTELRRQFGTDEQIDRVVQRAFGGQQLPPQKLAIVRANIRTLLSHEALPRRVAEMMQPLISDQKISAEEGKAAGIELILGMQAKGLRRLPTDSQAGFVRYMVQMMRMIPASQCKAMLMGQVSTARAAEIERFYMATLPQARFEYVQSLYLQAALSELRGYPEVRTITPEQAKLADRVLDVARKERLKKLPLPLLQRVSEVGLEGADADDACQFTSAALESMLDMKDPYLGWQLTRFVEGMQ